MWSKIPFECNTQRAALSSPALVVVGARAVQFDSDYSAEDGAFTTPNNHLASRRVLRGAFFARSHHHDGLFRQSTRVAAIVIDQPRGRWLLSPLHPRCRQIPRRTFGCSTVPRRSTVTGVKLNHPTECRIRPQTSPLASPTRSTCPTQTDDVCSRLYSPVLFIHINLPC